MFVRAAAFRLTVGVALALATTDAIAGGSIKDAPAPVRPGIYVELGAGAGWYDDALWTFADQTHDNDFKSGAVYRLAAGTRLPYGFRGELELAYRTNGSKDTVLSINGPFDLDGKVTAQSVMANVFYDFNIGRVKPFLGAGIGWAHLDLNTSFPGFDFVQADGTDDRFSYQLMAGASLPLTALTSLTLRYSFFDTVGDKMTVFNTGLGATSIDAPYSNHSVTLGLRIGY